MLNDLNILIGIEIELKIRGSTLPLFTNKIEKITKLFDQCFLLGGRGATLFFFFFFI